MSVRKLQLSLAAEEDIDEVSRHQQRDGKKESGDDDNGDK
jgi:hypothetical protein